MASDLDYFLHPESIAIIGASDVPGRVGHMYVANLVHYNFRGKIFPVNPRLDEVMGIKAYPHIKEIPSRIDLAVVAVRPSSTPKIIQDCGEKGVKAVLISSAGFADGDAESKNFGRRVVEIAREHGIRIMGPNTQGYLNLDTNLVALSVPCPVSLSNPRGIAFVCQTAIFYWDWIFRNPSMELTMAVDLGNMCDVNHADFLNYLDADPKTQVVALHIEGIPEGRRFMEIAGRVARKKPVIALKAGRTEKGARAIASHTGSLAGDDTVYDAAFIQSGIIRARDMDELNDFIKVFASFPRMPTGNRVGIITFSGAAGSVAADACEESGLALAGLSSQTTEKMRDLLPPWSNVHNPLDLFPVIEVDARISYKRALNAFSRDPNIDAVIIITLISSINSAMNAVDVFLEYAEKGPPKPTVICGLIDDEWLRKLETLALKGIPTFPTVERAVKALAAAYSRYRFLNVR